MSRILVVSPSFPPDKTVAVVRMASFVDFMLSKNEEVIIVTNKKKESFVTQSAGLRVEYVDVVENNGYYSFFKNAVKYTRRVEEILDEVKVDRIVISMGPFYTYKIAAIAKKRKVICLLDFRDPWSFDKREETLLAKVKRIIQFPIKYTKECVAISNADYVTTVTPGWVEQFKNFHPTQKEKIFLVENGYDDKKLSCIDLSQKKSSDRNRLLIGVFGKLFYYSEQYADVFLRAVKEVTDVDILIKQVGQMEENVIPKIASYKIKKDIVVNTGFMDYISGISSLMECDAFLVIDDRKEALGTKIYDYIFLNKPIIYVGPRDSAIASVIKNLSNCFTCDTKERLVEALRFLDQHRGLTVNCDRDFSRTSQNAIMYKLLKL